MSDTFLRIFAVDPAWAPDRRTSELAVALVRDALRWADDVSASHGEHPVFLDAGGNFESVRCPACGALLPIDWWHDAMDCAYEACFEELGVVVPCCGSGTDLNDLDYHWPQGFALLDRGQEPGCVRPSRAAAGGDLQGPRGAGAIRPGAYLTARHGSGRRRARM